MPANGPLDLSGMKQERFFKATKAEVRQWISGDGEPSEMHLVIDVIGSPLPVIILFRTPEEADVLIGALTRVRDAIWFK